MKEQLIEPLKLQAQRIELVVQLKKWVVQKQELRVGKTQQTPVHKHQVDDMCPQNVVDYHQSEQVLQIHEQTHEWMAQQRVEMQKNEEHQVVFMKDLVAQKLELQYELKSVVQKDLPNWVQPEHGQEKKVELNLEHRNLEQESQENLQTVSALQQELELLEVLVPELLTQLEPLAQ